MITFIKRILGQSRSSDGRYRDIYHEKAIKTARQMRADFEKLNPNHKWRKELP